MPKTLADLDTPVVLIDIDRVEANLRRAQEHADREGYALRPHIKTHKLPEFAKRQVELGATGITVPEAGRGRGDGRCRPRRHLPPLQHHRPAKTRAAQGARIDR